MSALALDTSVAIALLVATHRAHAALEHCADLATRDARAKATYDMVGVGLLGVGMNCVVSEAAPA